LTGGFPKRLHFPHEDTKELYFDDDDSDLSKQSEEGPPSPSSTSTFQNDDSKLSKQSEDDCPSPGSTSTFQNNDERPLSPSLDSPTTPQLDHTSTHQPTKPFDFLGLPLSVRKRIYTLLSTTPGLICLRQNCTPGGYATNAYIDADQRLLLPGISFALIQSIVSGRKSRFPRSTFTNTAILRVSKAVFAEAKVVMYGANTFELANLTPETAPPVDFKVPLFPRGYPRLIRKIVVRAKAVYGFQYLVRDGGYSQLKNVYRGLEKLTLILEVDKVDKGVGRKLAPKSAESTEEYVERVHGMLKKEIFDCAGTIRPIPGWVNLKVLFTGDSFLDENEDVDDTKKSLKSAVSKAFMLFHKGIRG
jgi:hypothetical protein